jgi:hypothetical protein
MKKLKREDLKKLYGGLLAPDVETFNGDCFVNGPGNNLTMYRGTGNVTNARNLGNSIGRNWCCASCNTATWMQPFIRN